MPNQGVSRNQPATISDDPEEFRATLTEHLDELRTRIIRVLVSFIVAWVAGYYLQAPIYEYVNKIVNKYIVGKKNFEYHEVWHNVTDPFMLKLRLSFIIGVILVFPILITQFWAFIKPGLKPVERKAITSIAPWTVVLFLMGVGFCWLIIPQAVAWFASYVEDFQGTILNQEAGSMVFFILKMLLAFGVAFQLPLVVFALGKVGILTPEMLLKYWRQATTAIFVLSMIITPSNDPGSMLMMAIPLSLLFMISVYLVKWTTKPKLDVKQGGADGD